GKKVLYYVNAFDQKFVENRTADNEALVVKSESECRKDVPVAPLAAGAPAAVFPAVPAGFAAAGLGTGAVVAVGGGGGGGGGGRGGGGGGPPGGGGATPPPPRHASPGHDSRRDHAHHLHHPHHPAPRTPQRRLPGLRQRGPADLLPRSPARVPAA